LVIFRINSSYIFLGGGHLEGFHYRSKTEWDCKRKAKKAAKGKEMQEKVMLHQILDLDYSFKSIALSKQVYNETFDKCIGDSDDKDYETFDNISGGARVRFCSEFALSFP